MAEPNRREDERPPNRRGEKRGADGESVDGKPERKERRRAEGAGNSRVDLNYIGHLEALYRRAPLSPEQERGAVGEYTRARAVASLKRRREEGFDDFDAELHYIDQLQARIAAIEHAKSCPRCKRLERELAEQVELRKEEHAETRSALNFLHAANVCGQEQCSKLVQQLWENQMLRRELDRLKAQNGPNK